MTWIQSQTISPDVNKPIVPTDSEHVVFIGFQVPQIHIFFEVIINIISCLAALNLICDLDFFRFLFCSDDSLVMWIEDDIFYKTAELTAYVLLEPTYDIAIGIVKAFKNAVTGPMPLKNTHPPVCFMMTKTWQCGLWYIGLAFAHIVV